MHELRGHPRTSARSTVCKVSNTLMKPQEKPGRRSGPGLSEHQMQHNKYDDPLQPIVNKLEPVALDVLHPAGLDECVEGAVEHLGVVATADGLV